jgi:xanthine dehydrogenase accessory factor
MLISPDTLLPGPIEADWPLSGLVDDIRPALAAMMERGEAGALATLVAVDGPSPRPLGSQMLINSEGFMIGYVSGGCVEGSIAILAQDVIATGKPQRFVFGADSPFIDIQLICGTRIEVLIEPVRPDDPTIVDLVTAYHQRTHYERQTQSDGQGQSFLCHYYPTARCVVLGQDPVALASVHVALTMGMEAILVREAGPAALPRGLGGGYLPIAVQSAFETLKLDAWTAIVTTTHDLDQDHAALVLGLASPCFYVGALGSRRRLDDRRTKLLAAGLSVDEIARLRAPVGLPIGAATPYEIAVSILADIVAARRGATS